MAIVRNCAQLGEGIEHGNRLLGFFRKVPLQKTPMDTPAPNA